MKMKTVALIGVVTGGIVLAVIITVVATTVSAGSPDQLKSTNQRMKAVVVFNVGSSGVTGFLELTQDTEGSPVHIKGNLTNLTPMGMHGFHVHQLGDVRGGCGSTKGHFNPKGKTHGAPSDRIRHAGDLGNIEADENGLALVDLSDSHFSLNGPTSIIGRAFVVHEKVDDLGKGGDEGSLATGNAGSRLKCGIIGLA